MKLITIIWHERGYSCSFYATATAPDGAAIAEARQLVGAARSAAALCGAQKRVHGLRVKISAHPTKL